MAKSNIIMLSRNLSMLICLFVRLDYFGPTREFFTHIIGEGLQILTYARHTWPLSSEGSIA